MPRATTPSPSARRRYHPARAAAALLLAGLGPACYTPPPAPPPPPAAAAMAADLDYLADPARDGRQLESPGRDSAADYIARRFAEAGLRPVLPGDCASGAGSPAPCPPRFTASFPVPPLPTAGRGLNVMAVVPGTDPRRAGQVVVVGAHYDHIGRLSALSRDPDRWGVRPGADDNASGTAAMLELARRVAARPLPRTVLFVAFDAEELGLHGSRALLRDPPLPRDSMVAMVNLDMVGRLEHDPLEIHGTGSDDRWGPLLERLAPGVVPGVQLRLRKGGGDSDHVAFRQAGIPALHFFTGLHAQYHTRLDRAELIDFAGMLRVVALAETVVRHVASRPER